MGSVLRSLFLRKPDPDFVEVAHEGGHLRVLLRRRPGARRLTLRVSNATGEAVLTLPARTSAAAAQRFAASQTAWIAARLAAVPARIPFAPDTRIPLRGETHRILHRPGRGATAAGRTEGEAVIAVSGEAPHLPRRVRDFLYAEARRDLLASIETYAPRLGQRPERITVRDTRSRWGSCTARGELNFSWRLILAPPVVLDYLVAHEMAHLREMNHSERFWALVEGVCPNVAEAEAWLKRHGSGLHRYG